MVNWYSTAYRYYGARYGTSVGYSEGFQWADILDNLGKCLGAAAMEHARERRLLWALFGWPLDGK